MSNLIYRQDAIDAMEQWLYDSKDNRTVREVVYELPSAEPEHICINLNEPIKVKLTDWGKPIGAGRPLADSEVIPILQDINREIGGSYSIERAIEVLEELPSASPDLSTFSDKLWKMAYERGKAEGRKKGKWIDKSDDIDGAWNYCSVCGEQAIDLYDFCPNCGADMRGE